jgi:hypothetical protein
MSTYLRATISKRLIFCAVVCVLSPGCSRGTQLIVINQSDVPLSDLQVSGSGFSEQVGTIAPHAQIKVFIHSRGESGLQVRFSANGKLVSFGPEGYFEPGYVVTAIVSPKLSVSVKSELPYY